MHFPRCYFQPFIPFLKNSADWFLSFFLLFLLHVLLHQCYWISWSNQIQVWEVSQQGDGYCFLGRERSCASQLLPHPPYRPDLAPSDFFLFPKLKEHLKGVCFNSTDEAKHAAKTWLRNQSAEFFNNGINGWKQHLGKCIDRDKGNVEK